MEGHGYSSLHLSIRDRFIAARRQHDFAGSDTFTGDIPVARTNCFWTAAHFVAFTQKALFLNSSVQNSCHVRGELSGHQVAVKCAPSAVFPRTKLARVSSAIRCGRVHVIVSVIAAALLCCCSIAAAAAHTLHAHGISSLGGAACIRVTTSKGVCGCVVIRMLAG
jgi:hypothetical protein